MKREADQALDSLRKRNIELGKGGTDGTPDITLPPTYEDRSVVQNDDGTWDENIIEEQFPAKKDIDQRASELEGFETDVINYKNLSKIGDNKVLSILGEINAKKLEILTTVNTAVSAGCTYFVGDGTKTSLVNSGPVTVGGVILGPANTQTVYNTDYPQLTEDSAKLYKYNDLNNYSSDSPFIGISSDVITGTNVGTGFSTACFANFGAAIEAGGNTQFKIIKGTEGGACAGYLNTINTLASEIDTLRNSLGTDWTTGAYVGVLKDTNQVKDIKTGSETMVWSYKNEDSELEQQKNSNNSLINAIESQSEFQ
tara:strand:+ start:1691 stop:2626 length:936 start_codon:yes stop_codon:yes gene_type:complete